MELSSVDGRGWYRGRGAILERQFISLPPTPTLKFFSRKSPNSPMPHPDFCFFELIREIFKNIPAHKPTHSTGVYQCFS